MSSKPPAWSFSPINKADTAYCRKIILLKDASTVKLKTQCPICSGARVKREANTYEIEIKNECVYSIDCKNGHRFGLILSIPLFEILAEVAIQAVLSGFYREAVSSLQSSLERFYEFFFKAISIKYEVDRASFDAAWKHLNPQSERQIGAFVASHVLAYKCSPLLPSTKELSFRNKVIHKGYIPTKDEVLDFGQSICNIVKPPLDRLRVEDRECMQSVIDLYEEELKKQIDPAMPWSITRQNFLFDTITHNYPQPIDFRGAISLRELWARRSAGLED